jgi:L-idonate 5-dehydrogenase
MRALVLHAPKDLRIEDRTADRPGPGEVRVAVGAGGICGSDLHYWQHGGFGTVRLREPMILGHEVAGTITDLGAGVSTLAIGQRVAVSPSRPCNTCRYCLEGRQNQCLDMRFYGSAMRMPHVQGAFCDEIVCTAVQCHPVADHVSMGEAALAEPLAVALHATRRAGPLLGKRVLVTGSGPIGVLCVIAARLAGAAGIVVTDLAPEPLVMARQVGAERALDLSADPSALDPDKADKGSFDVLFECSGSDRALAGAFEVLRPGAVIVQVGLAAQGMTLPVNMLVAKELELRGTFRFHAEYGLAVEMLNRRRVDVRPLVSATFPLAHADAAFALAADRRRSMKVQLQFG